MRSLQIQVWKQSLLRKLTPWLKKCPINRTGSGPEIKKKTFYSILLHVRTTEHEKNNSICFVQVQFWQLHNVYYILLNCFYPSLPLFNHSLLFIFTLYLVQFTAARFIVHCVQFHLVLWWMNNSAPCVFCRSSSDSQWRRVEERELRPFIDFHFRSAPYIQERWRGERGVWLTPGTSRKTLQG